MKEIKNFLALALLLGVLNACDNKTNTAEDTGDTTTDTVAAAETTPTTESADVTQAQQAIANIAPASGSELIGKATFTRQQDGKVLLVVEVQKATPGTHAVHLHENGDCSAADAKSAGGHWNPTNEAHGKRGTQPHHKGDLPNLEVNSDGTGRMEVTVDGWTIGGDAITDVVNKAIIVHAKADDYTSQPAGNAGDRVGCGVVSLEI